MYYSSLAFGGYEAHSVVGLQAAHIATEKMLEELVSTPALFFYESR